MKCPLCFSVCEPSINRLYLNCPEHGEMSQLFIDTLQEMDQFRRLLAYEEYKKYKSTNDAFHSFVNGQVLNKPVPAGNPVPVGQNVQNSPHGDYPSIDDYLIQ